MHCANLIKIGPVVLKKIKMRKVYKDNNDRQRKILIGKIGRQKVTVGSNIGYIQKHSDFRDF